MLAAVLRVLIFYRDRLYFVKKIKRVIECRLGPGGAVRIACGNISGIC